MAFTKEHLQAAWIVGGAATLAAYFVIRDYYASTQRGGMPRRHLLPSAVERIPLRGTDPLVVPDHLKYCYGETPLPTHWQSHPHSYPGTPGQELERLMYGASGAAVTPNVPWSSRGWMFAPPAEADY